MKYAFALLSVLLIAATPASQPATQPDTRPRKPKAVFELLRDMPDPYKDLKTADWVQKNLVGKPTWLGFVKPTNDPRIFMGDNTPITWWRYGIRTYLATDVAPAGVDLTKDFIVSGVITSLRVSDRPSGQAKPVVITINLKDSTFRQGRP